MRFKYLLLFLLTIPLFGQVGGQPRFPGIYNEDVDLGAYRRIKFIGSAVECVKNFQAEIECTFTGSEGSDGHTIQGAGTPVTARTNLNFLAPFSVADDSGDDATDIGITVPGSGTELQYRSSGTAFGAITGSSFSANYLQLLSTATNPTFGVLNSSNSILLSLTAHGSGYSVTGNESNHPHYFKTNNVNRGGITGAGLWNPWKAGETFGAVFDLSALSQSRNIAFADLAGTVALTTGAQTLASKTISGGTATTTHEAGANIFQVMRHATDCTAITDGADGELCYEKDSDTLYVCETADTCDTAGEWEVVTGSGSGNMTQSAENDTDNQVPVGVGASGRNFEPSPVTIDPSTGNLVSPGSGTFGSGPWNMTGLTDDVAPSAPGTANQFTAYVDRTAARLEIIRNGQSNPERYVAGQDVRWTPSISIMGNPLTTGDEKACVAVPPAWTGYTGWQLNSVLARNSSTADATGFTVQVHKLEGVTPVDMLSTAITTDAGEASSADATTPPVIDATQDDVAPGDAVCADVDAWDDGKDLLLYLEFIPI